MRLKSLVLAAVLAAGLGTAAPAAEGVKPPSLTWSFEGLFGTFDRGALQRGFQVYKEVCAACHTVSQLRYRDLSQLGYNEDEIKAIAAEYKVMDGPNDRGEMFERNARPADRFHKPFPNEQAARAANNGAYPVDLSLIVEARKNGANYLAGLLSGYRDKPPAGLKNADGSEFKMMEGMHYNEYFPGHQIAMGAPLSDDRVTYGDGTKATVAQMSKDVVTFLAWVSEPNLEHRKALGVKVILFLVILSGLLYAVKRKVWADLH
ncbi:MAG: cytochrome c1 [Alphaproteobacteria bacterium]|nr:cytochrome c1 [Alphaproteobacteria bacterium]